MELGRKNISRKKRGNLQGGNKKKQKVNNQISIEYYEQKINYLNSRNLHPKLVMLASRDAPRRPEDISSRRGIKRHIKKCIKYYEKKLINLNREKKKFFMPNFFNKFFLVP